MAEEGLRRGGWLLVHALRAKKREGSEAGQLALQLRFINSFMKAQEAHRACGPMKGIAQTCITITIYGGCTGLFPPCLPPRIRTSSLLLSHHYAVQNALKTPSAQQTACCCERDEHRAPAALPERRRQARSCDMAPTTPLPGAGPETIL